MALGEKPVIDWNVATLRQLKEWELIQRKWTPLIQEAYPLPDEGTMREYLGNPVIGIEDVKTRYRNATITNKWIFDNFRGYCEEAVLFWTNKRAFMAHEDDDYILGAFSIIANSPMPVEGIQLEKFTYKGVEYKPTEGEVEDKDGVKTTTPFTQGKLWQLTSAMSVAAADLTQAEQLANLIGIFYWDSEPNEDAVTKRVQHFMDLNVQTAVNVSFFLTNSLITFTNDTSRYLKEQLTELAD